MGSIPDDNSSFCQSQPQRMNTLLSGWVRDVMISLAVSAFFIIFLYQPVKVEGTSMMPTLEDQERVFINKFVYKLEPIARGDVIVFRYPRDPAKSYIKRVVAVAGDRVRIEDGVPKGTTFVVSLPQPTPVASEAPRSGR